VLSGLDPSGVHAVTLYNLLEPALWHPQPFLPSPGVTPATLVAITVDGALAPPPPPLSRNLVVVGDSITAGFGAGAEAPCGSSPTYQEDNSNTYGACCTCDMRGVVGGVLEPCQFALRRNI